MRVYIKSNNEEYDYPEQMTLILSYLKAHGELKVSGKTVESFYRDFSDERYAAGWMNIRDLHDHLLEEFADYLDEITI